MASEKACSIPYRFAADGTAEILAFHHPLAGKQFVKGTIEEGEDPADASMRELMEESGLRLDKPLRMGQAFIGSPPLRWHFYAYESDGLPESWDHRTEDDGGHIFSFFWHPVSRDLDEDWHPVFHQAYHLIRARLPRFPDDPARPRR
ncbi:MAG: NUDIX domain-containing protein [Sphingobium sp.]